MEGFALRDAGDEARAPLALRPVHLALVAFVVTLPAHAPTMGAFAEAPQFEAVADVFLFALFLAAVTSSAVVLLRGLQRPRKVFSRARVTTIAAVSYLLGTMGVLGLLFAPAPLPAAAAGAGLLAGAALPLLVAEWARAVAVPIDQALVLCAFVVLTASFVGWILALLPLLVLVPVFCLLLVAGVVVPPVAARVGDPALPLARPADTMRRLVSVTWLPLLGFAVYAFMTDVMAHSAFGVVQASFLGGAVAALVMFGVCFLWGRTPLLPWSYRILMPLMAAAFVVLGAFPAGTFPRDASVVALYVFYIVLALLGCAVLLAVVRNRELPANVASGFACGVAAAAALLGQILSQVLAVTDDFAPWLAVLTGAFVAVLLVFLGRTSWNELVAPRESAAAEESVLAAGSGAGDAAGGGTAGAARGEEPEGAGAPDGFEPSGRADAPGDAFELAESSMQSTLEARCAEVAAARGLSPREAEVLVFLARGFTPAYIAKSLVLSVSTVRTHVRNIYRKLDVNKREELIHLIDEG
ncbi:MAG: helix-turn-helix transcriptional regulator [Adlercreutzia equolifaciens]|nr:helix-turn-helix transcriptional regulator [Adlercreutzia equolifaciens]